MRAIKLLCFKGEIALSAVWGISQILHSFSWLVCHLYGITSQKIWLCFPRWASKKGTTRRTHPAIALRSEALLQSNLQIVCSEALYSSTVFVWAFHQRSWAIKCLDTMTSRASLLCKSWKTPSEINIHTLWVRGDCFPISFCTNIILRLINHIASMKRGQQRPCCLHTLEPRFKANWMLPGLYTKRSIYQNISTLWISCGPLLKAVTNCFNPNAHTSLCAALLWEAAASTS